MQPADFSPDEIDLPYGSATPYAWNPVGRSLLYTRFNFPIVALPNDQVSSVVQLAASNKAKGYNSFPQHAVHFFYYMGPSNLRSAQCLSDSSCLPLGGQSVWASLGAIVNDTAMDGRLLSDSRKLSTEPHQAVPIALHARKQQAKQSQMKPHIPTERRLGEVIGRSDSEFVMAVAQIDSDGLFHDIAYGADSAISGVVALLAAADALGKSDANTLPKKVRIAFEHHACSDSRVCITCLLPLADLIWCLPGRAVRSDRFSPMVAGGDIFLLQQCCGGERINHGSRILRVAPPHKP